MHKYTRLMLFSSFWFLAKITCADEQSLSFPLLGYLQGSNLYLPTFKYEHAGIPKSLYVQQQGKMFQVFLKERNYLIQNKGQPSAGFPGSDINGVAGAFVYEMKSPGSFNNEEVLVFEKSRIVTFKEKDTFFESKSSTEWKLISLGSSEGSHRILQTFENGKCVRSIDYYFYVPYDTEGASEEEFNRVLCGEKVEPFNAYP